VLERQASSVSNLCAKHVSNQLARVFYFWYSQITVDSFPLATRDYNSGALEDCKMLRQVRLGDGEPLLQIGGRITMMRDKIQYPETSRICERFADPDLPFVDLRVQFAVVTIFRGQSFLQRVRSPVI
jgi:hypothetical protein